MKPDCKFSTDYKGTIVCAGGKYLGHLCIGKYRDDSECYEPKYGSGTGEDDYCNELYGDEMRDGDD